MIIQNISHPFQGSIVKSKLVITSPIIPMARKIIILDVRMMPNIVHSLQIRSEKIPSTTITRRIRERGRKRGLLAIRWRKIKAFDVSIGFHLSSTSDVFLM